MQLHRLPSETAACAERWCTPGTPASRRMGEADGRDVSRPDALQASRRMRGIRRRLRDGSRSAPVPARTAVGPACSARRRRMGCGRSSTRKSAAPHRGTGSSSTARSMVVELRDGANDRAYRYHCPWAHPEWRSATLATAIARSLRRDRFVDDTPRCPEGLSRAHDGRIRDGFPSVRRRRRVGKSITSFGGCSSTHRRPCGRALHRRRSTRPRARNRCSTRLRRWASSSDGLARWRRDRPSAPRYCRWSCARFGWRAWGSAVAG